LSHNTVFRRLGMIIECQACHARFRLDESRIKGKGARVKCRKCGGGIVVLKDSAPPPPSPDKEGFFDLGSAVRDSAGESPRTPPPVGNLIPFTAKARPVEPGAKEPFSQTVNATEPEKDEVDLAFARVLSAAGEAPSPPIGETEAGISSPAEADALVEPEAETPPGPEARPALDLGALTLDLGPEEKLDLPPAVELEPPPGRPPTVEPSAGFRGEGGFLISDSDALDFLQEQHRDAVSEAPPGIRDISLEITSTPDDGGSSFLREPDPPPMPHEDWASQTSEEISLEGNVTPQAAERDVEIPPYREAEPVPAPPVEPPVRRGSQASESPHPRSSAGIAAAVVVAVLLAAGGYLGLTPSGRETLERSIPGVAALWGGKPAASAAPKYELRNVIGNYESGSASPRILVIKGQVANLSKVEKSGIRVHATLLDNTDAVLAQQAVYAGNVLSGEAIRKGNRDTLSKALGNRFGEGLANMNVAPNKAIPFMVVFFDAPAATDGYKLEAKDSE
jgi:predicted Zn finger-like uncharacterized protein